MTAGRFIAGVVPSATPGVPGGLVVVEFLDTPDTIEGRRSEAERDVLYVEELDADTPRRSCIDRVAEVLRPYGPGAGVVFANGGDTAVHGEWAQAYYPERKLLASPKGVTIVAGTGLAAGTAGMRIGESEIVSNLRELLATRGFAFARGEDAATLARAASKVQVSVAAAGTLRFPARREESLVFAAALAMHPRAHPGKSGRRFRFTDVLTGELLTFDSRAAVPQKYEAMLYGLTRR